MVGVRFFFPLFPTWCTTDSYVSTSSLALTASLYASQLTANLLLLQTSVQTLSTRVLLQNALQRYDQGNNTDANWVRAVQDLQSSLGGAGASPMLLQLQVMSKNGTGIGGPYALVNVTGAEIDGTIPLPYLDSNGSQAYLGDNGTGYPSNLYPNLTYTSTVINSTFNLSTASYDGMELNANTTLVLGPWILNSSFALMSITMPIINNTSVVDTLGWLTVIANVRSIYNIETATQGLGNTGQILLLAPNTLGQKLPASVRNANGPGVNETLVENQEVVFVLPPVFNASRSARHPSHAYGMPNTPFPMSKYPAVLDAYSSGTASSNGDGSILGTSNEEGDTVSVGYALAMSSMVDWALIVEESHAEVTAPIGRLRDILLACVFGTVGVLLLLLLPIAHISVRPIRRLREATKRSVEPEMYPSEDGSQRSSISEDNDLEADGAEDQTAMEDARKEGFMGRVTQWRSGKVKPRASNERPKTFRIPGKVQERNHFVQDELTDLTRTFNEMSEKLTKQYVDLEEKVKERTQQLEASKKAAEVANETKTLFIANISHELKTPLNGILGMCAVCMQEDDPTKMKRSLGIIYKSGDLLLHLLTDLLTFTKNQIGQQLKLDEREFRLADVCSQLLSIFEKQAKEGHINLEVSYQGPQDLGPNAVSGAPLQSGYGPPGTGRIRDMFLWGDQHRVLQVIINLVSNSLKFTPKDGTVNVRIRCLGDAPEIQAGRKGSIHSKQSKQSRRSTPRGSRQKSGRITSESGSVASAQARGREGSKYSDTALHINGAEPKLIPSVAVRERSTTPPPPLNARTLLFEFEVEDTGPGIPEDQQQRVFEPFMQGDLGLSKKYGGTGLGLSICSQLASLMRGSIRLESIVGVGSKFTMQIPLVFTKERADSTTSSKPGSRRNSGNFGGVGDGNGSPDRRRSLSDISLNGSDSGVAPALNGIDTPTKPRLVGLSQPFFASPSPLEDPDTQMAAIERVTAQAVQNGEKIRVLVAEDNKVNQEVVLRMLKLEDIYGKVSSSPFCY